MAFKKWSLLPDDEKIKKAYYPTLNKKDLFGNYIRELSVHSLGYAVDITVIDLKTGKELDMGTIFDYFGELGHTNFKGLPKYVIENRIILRNVMEKNGFSTIPHEWWHFNYNIDLAEKKYYDFLVK